MSMALPLLWLGLLSHVLMEVVKMPGEGDLCMTVPCRLEFSEETLSNFMITGYWLNTNISWPRAADKPHAAIDDNTNGRLHLFWNLEERDCTLLTQNALRRDNMTYTSTIDQGEQKQTFLRKNITLFLSDLTQKPELYIPDIPMSGKPVALTCTIRDSCIESRPPFLSWKERDRSFNTDGSRNSSSFSSVLHFTPKPKDHGTTLQCHLNFSLLNLSRNVKFSRFIPTTMFYHKCSLEYILQCNCSFYGNPTPFVEWFLGGILVVEENMSNVIQVITTTTALWANSTIKLHGEPEIVMTLQCRAKNKYGAHDSSVFLIPDESSLPKVFVRGLIQGIVYGSIIPALFFFFVVVFVMQMLKWWEKRKISKDEEALILEKPETCKETKA